MAIRSKRSKALPPLLTIREQQFYAFIKKFRGRIPGNSDLARGFNVSRQRAHQLMARLRKKGWVD